MIDELYSLSEAFLLILNCRSRSIIGLLIENVFIGRTVTSSNSEETANSYILIAPPPPHYIFGQLLSTTVKFLDLWQKIKIEYIRQYNLFFLYSTEKENHFLSQ